ncbi:TetR/AcrR family transcriptional regulator [Nocardia sp. NPDC052566]|uniref:TetR/AcrR family transcriptional regulator n=1 Tax=Nocardia sp. NPDC052566 TaxID=3364330 RepID=UPI0037CC9812
MASSTRTRMTATERSEEVLRAAVDAFAESGYAATKTDEIARRAGVSQPYVIRLFGSKQQLFIAAMHQVCDRIEQIFRAAATAIAPGTAPSDALRVIGGGFNQFLAERELLLVFMHGMAAASAEPVIGDDVRARFGALYALVDELTGAPTEERRRFFASGMLLMIMTAMRVAGPDAIPTPWATEMLEDLTAHGD